MSTPSKSTKSTRSTIWLRLRDGKFAVEALVFSPRIAVHQRIGPARIPVEGWNVSDPVTGMAWTDYHKDEASAIRFARKLLRRFGPNPLKGAIVGPDGGWKRRGAYHAKVQKFVRAEFDKVFTL